MTASGSALSSTSTPSADRRPTAEVIPIGRRVEPALVSLAAAAAASRVSDRVLWVEYLTLGGTADLAWFRDHLAGVDTPDTGTTAEHAVVVEMFTELFADEGLHLRVV